MSRYDSGMGRGASAVAGTVLAAMLLAGCAAAPAVSPGEPVIDSDFPDPDVLLVDGTYFAYATNDAQSNVQVATSTDLVTWRALPDAFPELPDWVVPGDTWAPEVSRVGDGYVLYFTAHSAVDDVQCIGTATSSRPAGPFTATGDGMLVCPADERGAIDASTFVDGDGARYLLYKNDGNCCGLDTWISAVALSSDGLALAGEPTRLIRQDQEWEGDLVEAPTMVVRDEGYVLFYSANGYAGPDYAIGYATAAALGGPWTKHDGPWLTSDDTGFVIIGPGGQDVTGDDDSTLVLHGWDSYLTYRALYVLPLEWRDGLPVAPSID